MKIRAMGNVVFWNNGQRVGFRITDINFLHKLYLYLEIASILNFFCLHAHIYMRMQTKKKPYLLAGRPPQTIFFYNKKME